MSEGPFDAQSSIRSLRGVGPKLAALFVKKGIRTLEDALFFVPRSYEDRRQISPISKLVPGSRATVLGRVDKVRSVRRYRSYGLEGQLVDAMGEIFLVWFHVPKGLREELEKENSLYLFHGEIRLYGGRLQIAHPEFERVEELIDGKPPQSLHFGRVIPVYSETLGLHQKVIRKVTAAALTVLSGKINERLSDEVRRELQLPTLERAFRQIHQPEGLEPNQALQRIIVEEFLRFQIALQVRRKKRQESPSPVVVDNRDWLKQYLTLLPFKVTLDQQKAIEECVRDLKLGYPTARLLQGDVGSGKTVVALAAVVVSVSAGFQAVMMAPTEVLANQHYASAQKFLSPLGIRVFLLVHETASNRVLKQELACGTPCVVVGTQALFQDTVSYGKLGLVIVDEQHRFGVEQRVRLLNKGLFPHLLLMSATPIPRTLALTAYGDLEISIIREKPKGRQKIVTRVLSELNRENLFTVIRGTIRRGEQVFIVYPLIEASDKIDLKPAVEMHTKLSKEVFPEYSLALLHGRMKSAEKDRILEEFRRGKFQILVSTTVIEVGIDVPNATLMVIEHPERLGLSQLHQLRGRVGRGSKESQCILVASGPKGARLRILERSEDGFEISEEDLRLRGPGEFLGTRQSGLPGFKVAEPVRDREWFELSRTLVQKMEPEYLSREEVEILQ